MGVRFPLPAPIESIVYGTTRLRMRFAVLNYDQHILSAIEASIGGDYVLRSS